MARLPSLITTDADLCKSGFKRAGEPSVRLARNRTLTVRLVWRLRIGAFSETHIISLAGFVAGAPA